MPRAGFPLGDALPRVVATALVSSASTLAKFATRAP